MALLIALLLLMVSHAVAQDTPTPEPPTAIPTDTPVPPFDTPIPPSRRPFY
jgi:hypothetical protein